MPLANACTNIDVTIIAAAIGTFIIMVLVYWPQLARGISDVGFVGNTLRAERIRYRGI
jgi:hypothetical protein